MGAGSRPPTRPRRAGGTTRGPTPATCPSSSVTPCRSRTTQSTSCTRYRFIVQHYCTALYYRAVRGDCGGLHGSSVRLVPGTVNFPAGLSYCTYDTRTGLSGTTAPATVQKPGSAKIRKRCKSSCGENIPTLQSSLYKTVEPSGKFLVCCAACMNSVTVYTNTRHPTHLPPCRAANCLARHPRHTVHRNPTTKQQQAGVPSAVLTVLVPHSLAAHLPLFSWL